MTSPVKFAALTKFLPLRARTYTALAIADQVKVRFVPHPTSSRTAQRRFSLQLLGLSIALRLVSEHLSCRREPHPISAAERDKSEINLPGVCIRFEYDGQSLTGAAMAAHEPSIQFSVQPDA
ncbi:MAG: hypothetical protein MRY81_25350 [Donghicola eburneus]|nr:hypothetical protein [Donghicola eburneus]MCI5042977.1 hypothetical protein [Donghicola eburneus]